MRAGRSPAYDVADVERRLRESSPSMARMIDRIGPLGLQIHSLSPFEALLRSIVYQQLAGSAASAIWSRVRACFSRGRPTPRVLLALDAVHLRDAGLSAGKLAAAKVLARRTMDGTIPTRRQATTMSDEELVQRITTVKGIGPWTVEMFLIFGLGRPDVWPVLDLGVRKGLARTFRRRELPTPREALLLGRKFAPYRSAAAWFMWRAAELPDAKKPA